MSTELDVRHDVRLSEPELEEGDHDRYAHYVRKADQAMAYIEGVPIRALCGKVWVPNRDPSKFPVCPECKEIMGRLRGAGEIERHRDDGCDPPTTWLGGAAGPPSPISRDGRKCS